MYAKKRQCKRRNLRLQAIRQSLLQGRPFTDSSDCEADDEGEVQNDDDEQGKAQCSRHNREPQGLQGARDFTGHQSSSEENNIGMASAPEWAGPSFVPETQEVEPMDEVNGNPPPAEVSDNDDDDERDVDEDPEGGALLAFVLSRHNGLGDSDSENLQTDEEDVSVAESHSASVISEYLMFLHAKRGVPLCVIEDLRQHMKSHKNDWLDVISNNNLKHTKTSHRNSIKLLPPVRIDVQCQKPNSDRIVKLSGLDKFPKKRIISEGYILRYTLFWSHLGDLIEFHKKLHPNKRLSNKVDISLDGVPEAKSNPVSFDILSLKFVDCRNVYVSAILRPGRKGLALDESIILNHFIEDFKNSNLKLRYVIADAPKRAKLRGLRQHNATYGCPYCEARRVNGNFPASTINQTARSHDSVMNIAEKILTGELDALNSIPEALLGVCKVSPLLAIPSLDIIEHIPCEKMHAVDLGIVRRLMSYFYTGSKTSKTPLKKVHVAKLNEYLRDQKVISECSRRTRDLDVGVWKASEYKQLVLSMWPAVAETCRKECRELWILTTFIVRALCLPDETYNEITTETSMELLMKRWYVIYEKTLGPKACVYNVHIFHHLLRVRQLGPLTLTSAYPYEDHYSSFKKSYCLGTASTGLQAMRNLNLALLAGHKCKRTFNFSTKETSKIDDSVIYTCHGRVVQVCNRTATSFSGKVIDVCPFNYTLPGLDFNKVLAFKVKPQEEQRRRPISGNNSDVYGKCIMTGEYISVLSRNMITE